MAALDSPAPRTGLTFDQLAATTPEHSTYGHEPLKQVLRTETSAGRVTRSGTSSYALRVEAFDPAVLAALRALSDPAMSP